MNKQKAIDAVMLRLNGIYCYNCNHNNKEDNPQCDDCHRKYMNWSISEFEAMRIVEEVVENISVEE